MMRAEIVVDKVDGFACRPPLFIFLNILCVPLDIHIEILQKTMTLFVVVSLIVHPVPIEGKPEIRNLQMARSLNQKIIRFDITMNPIHLVRLFDTQNHLGDILFRNVLVKYVFAKEEA